MAIDFNKPINTDAATGVLAQIRENLNSVLTQTQGTGTNVPTNSIRINPTTSIIEIYNGSIWSRHGPILTHFASVNSAGSANAQTATFSPVPSALADGQVYFMTAGFANTGSMTLNPNALGAITVFDSKTGVALVGGEIFQYMRCQFLYSNGNFYLLNGVSGLWSSFATTHTGFSVNPTYTMYHKKRGRDVLLNYSVSAGGTSNATTYTVLSPFTARTIANINWRAPLSQVLDNSAFVTNAGWATLPSGSNVITLTKFGGGAWTAANAKQADFQLIFEAAS